MRQIFTLISCFILFLITAAQSPKDGKNVIKMRATATPSTEKPLFVIDGVVCDEFDLKKMDPNNIESINILKDVGPTTIYCNWSSRGIIIITTKTANQRVIKVNDILTGERLPGATIELLYKENEQDVSFSMKTDSLGCLITNKIVNGKEYELRVSSVGYKTFTAHVNSKTIVKSYSVLLERNYSKLDEVVIVSYPGRRIACGGCKVIGVVETAEQKIPMIKESGKIYPNPVLRSQKVTIEYNSENEKKLTLRLFGFDGKLINSKEYSVVKGISKFEYLIDSKLTAGFYILQVVDANDKLIRSEKLIVQ
jgi:hypothetical protein